MPDGPSYEASPYRLSGYSTPFPHNSSVMAKKVSQAAVVGGLDTHKDLHVAAVVDQNINSRSPFFSSIQQDNKVTAGS